MFESILNHIQTRLKEIPGLRYVDEDWGQLSAVQAPVAWPCALIDVDGFQYSQIGHHAQQATGEVYVTVAEQRLSRKDNGSFFALLEAVHKSIHGTAPEGCAPLIRTRLSKIINEDGIRAFRFTFQTAFTIESPRASNTTIITNLNIKL